MIADAGSPHRLFDTCRVRVGRPRIRTTIWRGATSEGAAPLVLDVAQLSAALCALMAALGLQRAGFVANSLGCQIVADLAVRRPDLVARAAFVGPTMDPRAPTVSQ